VPLRHITLRQLKVFEAVARHLSFSRAAEELHLTQPAVSMQVKSLEAQAELPLVEQVGKRIHLTEAGAEIARFALEVHSGLKDCEDTLAAIRGVSGGRLHLAVVSTAKYFAPRLLAEFSRRHPGVTVKLSVTNREQVIGELQANQVDLAIMGRPPRGLDVEAIQFAKHPHGIVAPPDHPLARRRGLELAKLAGENFLIREPGSGTRMAMERVFADHLVHLLPVGAGLHGGHQQTLGGGEWTINRKVAGDGCFIDRQTGGQLLRGDQQLVRAQECFRQDHAPVGRVVQRAFQQ